MKSSKTIIFILVGLLIINIPAQILSKDIIKHEILNNEIYDAPVKTQVVLDVLILDKNIDKQTVTDLLNYLYDQSIKRTGFKYHKNPTNIFIYAYTTKEKAESGMGQWIGMISKSYNDNKPSISLSDVQFKSLSLKPIEKFGLSEAERLEIWNKSIKIEDRAQKEADVKYPLDKIGITINDIKNNSAMYNKLKEKYISNLAKEYNITTSIIDSIGVEGLTKGWSFPKYY